MLSGHAHVRYTGPTMRFLAVLSLAVVLPAFSQTGPNADLQKLFREYYEMGLRQYPEAATYAGRDEYDDRWTDWSLKGMAEEISGRRDIQKRLQAFRGGNLNDTDRLSVELLEYELRNDLEEIER